MADLISSTSTNSIMFLNSPFVGEIDICPAQRINLSDQGL